MVKIIIIVLLVIITEFLTYKLIKWIDKKERKKLYEWELKYIVEIDRIKTELANNKKRGKKDVSNTVCDNSTNNQDILESEASGIDNMQATE